MKKVFFIVAALALLTCGAFAQFGEGKFSFSLFGGYGLSQAKGTSSYSDNWDGYLWPDNYEYADISYKADNGVFFGGAFSYMFSPNIGLQFGGGLFGRNVPNDTLSGWEAFPLGVLYYYDEYAYSGSGKLSTIPIYLNFVGRFSAGMFDINVSAGPTIFLNKAEAAATGIFGVNWVYRIGAVTYSTVDFLPVDMEISESWTGFGANFGAGFDFNLSPMFAIFLDARYFLCGAKELTWDYIPGIYDGQWGNISNWEFTSDDVDYIIENELTTPYKINPSFFVISTGFKVRFGGGSF